jgi:hypothetical protein
VTLTGTVAGQPRKTLAEDTVERLLGKTFGVKKGVHRLDRKGEKVAEGSEKSDGIGRNNMTIKA